MSEGRNSVVFLRASAAADAPITDRDDEALMTLAAADHRGAFEALVERHLPRLTSYCAKFLGDRRSGEEVAQELLVELWAQRRRYRPTARFRVFLLTLARSRCLNQLRNARRRGRWLTGPADDEPVEAAASTAPGQLEALLEEERRRHVREAVHRLPPKLREAALLRFDQGLDYAEIARVAGCPEGTARSRVFLAVKALRETIGGAPE